MKKEIHNSVSKFLDTHNLSFRHFISFNFVQEAEMPFFLALPKRKFSSKEEIELSDSFLDKTGYPIYFFWSSHPSVIISGKQVSF